MRKSEPCHPKCDGGGTAPTGEGKEPMRVHQVSGGLLSSPGCDQRRLSLAC